jgi:hypothetical protein
LDLFNKCLRRAKVTEVSCLVVCKAESVLKTFVFKKWAEIPLGCLSNKYLKRIGVSSVFEKKKMLSISVNGVTIFFVKICAENKGCG